MTGAARARPFAQLGTELYVDGAWRAATSTDVSPVIDPSTEEVVAEVPVASTKDVVAAVEAARRAFDEGPWPRLAPRERSAALVRLADRLDAHLPELIELNILEAGSVRSLAESTQTRLALDHLRHWAERAGTFSFVEPLPPLEGTSLGQGTILKEPVGVVVGMTPFNFPFYLDVWKVAPALAMGNTMVLKPSPYTPLEAMVIGLAAEEAELPPGVLNVVTGDTAAGQELSSHPAVDMVSFTGSDVVGRRIMGQAADTVKRLLLELGGKSPNIVFGDVDLDAVAVSAANAYIRHSGQGCGNATRILVQRSVHDELVERMVDHLATVVVGNPADPDVTMGPLIRDAQRARAERYIASGLADGATIAFGGARPAHLPKGYYLEPTLLVGVDNRMAVAQDEIFGPVAVVIPFDDEDDAVRIANDTRFGLCSWVWSHDARRAYRVAQRLRVGMVNVNGGAGLSLAGTFGGYKHSGLGRENSDHGLHEYLELKTVYWPVAGA